MDSAEADKLHQMHRLALVVEGAVVLVAGLVIVIGAQPEAIVNPLGREMASPTAIDGMTGTAMVVTGTGTATGTATVTGTATAIVIVVTDTEAERTMDASDIMRMIHTMTLAPREDTEYLPHEGFPPFSTQHGLLVGISDRSSSFSRRLFWQWVRQGPRRSFRSPSGLAITYNSRSITHPHLTPEPRYLYTPLGSHHDLILGMAVSFPESRRLLEPDTWSRPLSYCFPYRVIFLLALHVLLPCQFPLLQGLHCSFMGKYVL